MIRQPTQFTHASGLHSVARELARLHDATVRPETDEPRTVRLPLLTFVAVCIDQAAAEVAAETVQVIAEAHPTRALIIVASAEGPDAIEADLAIHNSKGDARSEQVRLTVTGAPALHLVSVVTPLLVPDVPVYLWMVGAPPLDQAFGQDSLALAERLIIDTGAYPDPLATLRTLETESGPDAAIALADLAWERSRRWRELIAQSFDGLEVRRFVRSMSRVSVLVSGTAPSAQAWLLIGWLAARLQWAEGPQPEVRLLTSAAGDVDRGDILAVRIDCERSADEHAMVRVERHDDVLYTGLAVNGTISASRTMPVDTLTVVQLVGNLMEEPGEDPAYRDAVRGATTIKVSES